MAAQEDGVEAQAIYLVPPHGELIWKGEKKLVVKIRRFQIDGRSYLLASGDHLYGRVKFGNAVKLDRAEFNRRQPDHMISDAERKRWWPEATVFWAWPVTVVERFDPPRPFERPAGVQTFISEVVIKDGTEEVQLMPTNQDDGLASGTGVIVDSVATSGNDLDQYVAKLLDTFNMRVYAGQHHDMPGPTPSGEVAKAQGATEEVEPSSMPAQDSMYESFTNAGALDPPLPPDFFVEVLRVSNSLRQNLDVYTTNVDGFGHHFEPVLDLDSDDSWRLIGSKLRAEAEDGEIQLPDGEDLDGVIQERLDRYLDEAALEKSRLEAFFDWAGLRQSFIKLRQRTRFDRELVGFAGWEVLRNRKGEISKFVHVPAYTLRLMPADQQPTRIIERQRHGAPWESKDVAVWCYFRRFVHWQGGSRQHGRLVYFRDFLDPRTVSRNTGRYYRDANHLKAEEGPEAVPANELIYFSDGSLDSPYGEPRWIGNLLSVLGSRSSEEVNYLFFQNKSIPPMVITMSGAALRPEDVEALKARIRDELHGGTDKFHKVLIITANVNPQSGINPDIDFKPLTDAMLKEALFQDYDKANRQKVGESFRVPPILRGDTKDFNRATAQAALRFSEMQVFQGLREDFDWMINHLVISSLGARYWKFASNGPPLRDPQDVVEMVTSLSKEGIMTPAEARRELAGVGFHLDKIEEPWTKRPIQITALGVGFEPQEGERVIESADTAIHDPDADPMDEEAALRVLENIMQEAVQEGKVEQQTIQRLNLQQLRRRLRGEGFQDEEGEPQAGD